MDEEFSGGYIFYKYWKISKNKKDWTALCETNTRTKIWARSTKKAGLNSAKGGAQILQW